MATYPTPGAFLLEVQWVQLYLPWLWPGCPAIQDMLCLQNVKAIRSEDSEDPLSCLKSNSESEEEIDTVKTVRVVDEGSRSQKARVVVGGVPLWGIVDSGTDITIMGSSAFKQVTSVAKLKRQDFKKLDKVSRNYDRQPFHVDGKININMEFQGKTMKTPAYIKMDAPQSLLLSEGVCTQLDIITYHSEVQAKGLAHMLHSLIRPFPQIECHRKPTAITYSSVFVINLPCMHCIDDLRADDNGAWIHGGKPRRTYHVVSRNGQEIESVTGG